MKEYSDKAIYRKITQFAELKNKKILEIGCGNGRISSLLATEPCSLIAIDPDEIAIKKARKNSADIDFRIGNGERLDFSDSVFDLIIFTLSLHHQNSEIALTEAIRTLKKDGVILVIEPVVEGEIEQVFSFLIDENKEKKDAQISIAKSGLLVVESEKFEAIWEFRDKDDLIHSVFQYYEMHYQPDKAKKIIDFVGNKFDSEPIILVDTMIIQSLKKAD